jgi:hypothetical protein
LVASGGFRPWSCGRSVGLVRHSIRLRNGEPILARPVGGGERLWHGCCRKPAIAALSAAVVGALLHGIAVSSHFAVQSARHAEQEQLKAEEADKEKYDGLV